MSPPSKQSLAGHHLTEAIKHLYAAAELVRDLDAVQDASEVALSIEGAAETARDIRGEIQGHAPEAQP